MASIDGIGLVCIPTEEYQKLVETKTRFAMLSEYLTSVYSKEVDDFPAFNDGFIKAVIGYKKGEVNAEKDHP